MRFQGFIGPSYTLQSPNVDAQRCVNLYPEINESGAGKEAEVASLVSTPGLRLLVTLPTGPVRGIFKDSTGQLWAVGGNVLYTVSEAWSATSVGTLNTSIGPVSFSDNGLEVVVVDGPYGYFYTIATAEFTEIDDANFSGADQVTFIDGYFIFNRPNSEQFYLSPLNAVIPFNGADVASAEANPDDLVGLVATQENLYLFGTDTVEIFYDSGDSNFPFSRIQGAVMELGCAAAFSVVKVQSSVFWLGQDKEGRGSVYRAQGLQPQKISTVAVENAFKALDDLSEARGWAYQQAGHTFYCLNIPGLTSTWVFDASTNLWHERAYLSQGQYQRNPADCHAAAYNTNVVGDYSSGKLYALDPEVYTDNGNTIVRERTAPHIAKDMHGIFHSRFELDIEAGVGLSGTGQGIDPQAILQWSNDGGHSWSNEHWASIGQMGERKNRVTWRRLGRARDRVYRVRVTDPVKVTMMGAELEITEGTS